MRDFDVEAVNAVVLDLEIGDTGARALARLEVDQKRSAMRVDRAKLVELGVEPGRDDAAVADLRGRVGRDRACEELCPLRIAIQIGGKRGEKRRFVLSQCGAYGRQQRERVAQSGKLARTGRGECDARGDPLDVDRVGE